MNVGEFYNPYRLFTGIFIPDAMAASRGISPGAKLCFGRLCFYAGRNGECFPSLETLGEDIGVSTRSAQAYVLELEDQGFIKRFRRGPNNNTYRFVWSQELEDSLKVKDQQDSAGQESGLDRQNSVERSAKNRFSTGDISLKVLREVLREEESPPTPSVFATYQELRQRWDKTRGLPRIGRKERERLPEWKWQMTVAELDSALAAFSEWLKGASHPIASPLDVFMRDSRSWLTCHVVEKAEPYLPVADVSPVPAVATDPVESRIRMIVRNTPRFQKYLKLFLAAGKELTDPAMEDCYSAWIKLGESEQDGAIAHAERNFPTWKLIPSPVNHLAKKPWTAIFMQRVMPVAAAQMSKSEQAREIARAKGWNV